MLRRSKTAILLLGVGLMLGSGALAGLGSTSTYLGRWVWWNRSDVEDVHRFPSRAVETGGTTFTFAEHPRSLDPVVTVDRDGRRERLTLSALARSTGTHALLVIRRDTILFERYFEGRSRASTVTSFSVAKSVTSLLVGIALEEGIFRSVDEPITRYLPELADRDPRFRSVTLRHLLDMRSGVAFRDHDLPWGDKARAYYDPHLRHRVLREVGIDTDAGREWEYNTYNPIFVGLALERASGMSVAAFTSERLWRPLGAEYPASWSVDGTTAPIEKMESGLNARPVDFAKLGRLVLRRGDWNGRRVVSEAWIDASSRPGPGCGLEAFRPAELCYSLGWWVTPPGEDRRRAVEARGHLGQYVALFPDHDLVIVRFGREIGGVSWPAVFQAVAGAVSSPAAPTLTDAEAGPLS